MVSISGAGQRLKEPNMLGTNGTNDIFSGLWAVFKKPITWEGIQGKKRRKLMTYPNFLGFGVTGEPCFSLPFLHMTKDVKPLRPKEHEKHLKQCQDLSTQI